ncbi:MAG: hypothetical protein EOO20_17545 [Chryseobacterium sp.]|nr:MAG: hypothetical protein EOO20_17545 [Chryseobacterium sp.]
MNKFLFLLLTVIIISCDKEAQLDEIAKNHEAANVNNERVSGEIVPMLWNHRMTKRAWLHLNQDNNTHLSSASSMDEANLDGNPSNIWPYQYTATDMTVISASDRSEPSALFVSLKYDNSKWGQYPGYDLWQYNPVAAGEPRRFLIMNNAKHQFAPDSLHETGFVFNHWNAWETSGLWAFREQYKLSDFSEIKPYFKAAIENYSQAISAQKNGVYLTADFRYMYIDQAGNTVRSELIGVIFSNLDGSDLNGNIRDGIYWKDFNASTGSNRILLQAHRIGLSYINPANPYSPSLNGVGSVAWTTITFDYLDLIAQYMPPPPPNCIAVITGFDIYSASRGGDICFWLQDVQLNGKRK